MTAVFTVLGVFYYFGLYNLFIYCLKNIFKNRLKRGDLVEISLRLVSAVQGLTACAVGWCIMCACSNDILYDTHWLTDVYCWFGAPYFYYDAYVMYQSFLYNRPHLQGLPFRTTAIKCAARDPIMTVHHLVMPIVMLPFLVFCRQGLGDFFVGCFFMCEVPILFLSVRGILIQLKQEKSKLYLINGALLVVTWISFRVLIFPYMYHVFARYRRIPLLSVPLRIPIKCNIGSLVLTAMQVLWMVKILRIAVSTISGTRGAKPQHANGVVYKNGDSILHQNGAAIKEKVS